MGDLISRQAVIDAIIPAMVEGADAELIEGILYLLPSAEPDTCEYWDAESKYCALNRPSAEPQRKKGKWVPVPNTRLVTCECGFTTDRLCKYNFCPDCGAEMTEGESDE